MNKEQSKFYVKNCISDYIAAKGINTRKPFRCLNPLHNDKKPSMSLDFKRKKVHCFSCGADYDTFDLIGIDYNLHNFSEIYKKACAIFKITGDFAITDYIKQCHNNVSKTDYFRKRGLSDDIISRFKLGYDEKYVRGTGGYVWKAAIIPTGVNSFTARNTADNACKSNRIRKQGGSPIFNFNDAMKGKGPVFVVEGEFDALSVIEAGGNAIALGSISNLRQLGILFKGNGFYNGFTVIISLDNDTKGRDASYKLSDALNALFIPCVAVDISLGYKDQNEAIRREKKAFIQKVQETSLMYSDYKAVHQKNNQNQNLGLAENEYDRNEYVRSSAAFCLGQFKNSFEQKNMVSFPVSTGFSKLDSSLAGDIGTGVFGSLFPGLYVIGAMSSIGKTTFILQMADNIALERDVLIFSLEMTKKELIAKSISRHTLLECMGVNVENAKTSTEIMFNSFDKDDCVYRRALNAYESYANSIYIDDTVRSIKNLRNAVHKHMSLTDRVPVVFVDYIQILENGYMGSSDKQHMDRTIVELKKISREFNITVIGVSSFNRQSYKESVAMEAFKESGAIEYSSDVLMGMQLSGAGKKDFDLDKEKCKNPRQVELKILKNRNGPTGNTVVFNYYPKFNYFRQL